MAISLAGVPQVPYAGTPSALPMQIAQRPGVAAAYCVPLEFNWLTYGANANNQNLVVNVDLSGNNVRQPLDKIRSIYIDNTNSAVPIYVVFPDTMFTVNAQPYSSGWYPVFTNIWSIKVCGFGFTNVNIPFTRIFVSNVFAPPYTDVALQSSLTEFLSSPVIGGGSSISSIIPLVSGQSYVNGNLNITGGGGSGAAAQGSLDQWGRFTGVAITNPGQHFSGQPIITPTGANPAANNYALGNVYAPQDKVTYNGTEWRYIGTRNIQTNAAAWSGFTFYLTGVQVNFNGIIYQALQNSGPPNPGYKIPANEPAYWAIVGTPSPDVNGNWINSGSPGGTNAQFTTLLTEAASVISSSGFAPGTLGDQAEAVFDLATLGKFRRNLWGTPYASGFIYLKCLDVRTLFFNNANATCDWQISNDSGYAPYTFQSGSPQQICNLQGMNQKLDATVEWFLDMTVLGSFNVLMSHAWCWTYSQQ